MTGPRVRRWPGPTRVGSNYAGIPRGPQIAPEAARYVGLLAGLLSLLAALGFSDGWYLLAGFIAYGGLVAQPRTTEETP